MTADAVTETVGIRVARLRKRRGLTQHGLAQRANYSRSHIAAVEAGHRMPTPAFVSAVAGALGADAAEVYGQPYRSEHGDDQIHSAIPELRRVLVYADVASEPHGRPRTLDQLAAEVATAHRLLAKAQLTKLGTSIPAVIEELSRHAYEDDAAESWVLLTRAHYAAASLTRRLGYVGDALALLERADDCARRSDDPHLQPGLVTRMRALLMMAMAQYRPALVLLERAAGQLDHERDDLGEVAAAIELRAAVVAARCGDDTTAWGHWCSAAERLESGQVRTDRYDLQVTAANVAIHGAAVAVELGDLDEAARRDHTIGDRTLSGVVPERRAHHEIDMARVHVETGDHGKALERLLSAEKTAPQMTRFHPSARSVVAHLVDVRRNLPEPLRALHHRMSA